MVDRPSGGALLAEARASFESEVMPHIPRESRYVALMILRAMEIAERELDAAEPGLPKAYVRAAELLTIDIPVCVDQDARERAMGQIRGDLVGAIRAGDLDHVDGFSALVREMTAAALALSNPKALDRRPWEVGR